MLLPAPQGFPPAPQAQKSGLKGQPVLPLLQCRCLLPPHTGRALSKALPGHFEAVYSGCHTGSEVRKAVPLNRQEQSLPLKSPPLLLPQPLSLPHTPVSVYLAPPLQQEWQPCLPLLLSAFLLIPVFSLPESFFLLRLLLFLWKTLLLQRRALLFLHLPYPGSRKIPSSLRLFSLLPHLTGSARLPPDFLQLPAVPVRRKSSFSHRQALSCHPLFPSLRLQALFFRPLFPSSHRLILFLRLQTLSFRLQALFLRLSALFQHHLTRPPLPPSHHDTGFHTVPSQSLPQCPVPFRLNCRKRPCSLSDLLNRGNEDRSAYILPGQNPRGLRKQNR